MKLMIINGSVRTGRVSEKIQQWAVKVLSKDTDLELDVVDLKEVDLPFFDEAVIPAMAKEQFVNPKGTAWAKRVREADAFIFITPEYNHGPSAVLKNAIDWVYEGWLFKPAGFISYGGIAGGTRAVQQLKQNLLNVNVFPVNFNVHIPNIWTALDENGEPTFPGIDDNLRKVATDLKALQKRLKD